MKAHRGHGSQTPPEVKMLAEWLRLWHSARGTYTVRMPFVCLQSYMNSTCKVQSLLNGTLTKEREISSRKPVVCGCGPLPGMALCPLRDSGLSQSECLI